MKLPLLNKIISSPQPSLSPDFRFPFDGEDLMPLKGGSGADVTLFRAIESPQNKLLRLTPNKSYIFKSMSATALRGIEEEKIAYDRINCEELFTLLKPLYVKKISTAEEARQRDSFFLEVAPGKLLADALKEGHFTPESYQLLFNQTIALFVSHFNKNAVSTLDFYSEKTGVICTPEVCIEHVKRETLGKVLERLSMVPVAFKETLKPATLTCFGIDMANPIAFFETLYQSPEASQFAPLFSKEESQKILMLLQPRSLALLPTDPSPTNATIGEDGSLSGTWFDPGRIEMSQLSYPLCKHEGPFAQLFIFIISGQYTLHQDPENGFVLQLSGTTREAWDKLKAIHSEPEIYKRLSECESGRQLLSEKPFFMLQLIFFGWRQFGSDLVYRNNDRDRNADFCLFTLGMDYIQKVVKNLLTSIQTHYPQEDFHQVISTADYYPKLTELCNAAFTVDRHPLEILTGYQTFDRVRSDAPLLHSKLQSPEPSLYLI